MAENPILAFFTWWNQAMADPALLTEEGFAAHFAGDGRLVVNGGLRATGPAALAVHYAAIAARFDGVEMVLPVEEAFADSAASRAFVHCRTRVVKGEDTAAEEAMAYAVMAGDRIALLRVVSLSV